MSSYDSCLAEIEDFSIKNSTNEELLGVKLDSNLYFENHVSLFKKRRNRVYTLLQEYHIART